MTTTDKNSMHFGFKDFICKLENTNSVVWCILPELTDVPVASMSDSALVVLHAVKYLISNIEQTIFPPLISISFKITRLFLWNVFVHKV